MSTEDTEPQNDGQVVPFAAVLQQIRQGDFHSLLSSDLQDLTRRVMATGKKGSMTVTLTVAPMKGAADNNQPNEVIDGAFEDQVTAIEDHIQRAVLRGTPAGAR